MSSSAWVELWKSHTKSGSNYEKTHKRQGSDGYTLEKYWGGNHNM